MNAHDVVFREVGIGIICNIHDSGSYKTEIAKKIDVTYSHVVKLIHVFVDSGHVTITKKGRVAWVHLTQKGRELKELLGRCRGNLAI